MIRLITCGSVLCFLIAAPPAGLFAQVDPRVRRAWREEAVAAVGPVARDFVETHGDDAVAALFTCSRPVAVKLAEFHASGELNKLPRPRDLLRVIALRSNGDDVALWAIKHANELADTDNFDAYLQTPLEYALGLKQLAAGAAEARAGRLSAPATATPTTTLTLPALPALPAKEWQLIAGGGGVVVFIALLAWRRKHRQGP